MSVLYFDSKYMRREVERQKRKARFIIQHRESLVVCVKCGRIWLPGMLYLNGVHGSKHYRYCPYCGCSAKIPYEKACEENFTVKIWE